MKKHEESKNRFPLSELHPSEYPIDGKDDAVCVDIALAIGESDMRFILARRHQLGLYEIELAYSAVKDAMRRGKCRNPRGLFNFILTQRLEEKKSADQLRGRELGQESS